VAGAALGAVAVLSIVFVAQRGRDVVLVAERGFDEVPGPINYVRKTAFAVLPRSRLRAVWAPRCCVGSHGVLRVTRCHFRPRGHSSSCRRTEASRELTRLR